MYLHDKGEVKMAKTYDLLLKNLKIIDGTGAPAYYGNIGIIDDTIADIGETPGDSKNVLDCTDLVAAPGFIDIHTHGDIGTIYEPLAKNYIYQGITTLVTETRLQCSSCHEETFPC